MTLGKRIGALRREKHLSQEFVAASLNVSRQAVSKWENDQSRPDTRNLIDLAALLETDVEFLATGSLTEEMEPEAVQPEPEAPSPPKTRKDPKRLLCALLVCAIVAAAVFAGLWLREKNDFQELETLCAASAYNCFEAFRDYRDGGSEGDYWKAAAEFRTFMQTMKILINEEALGSRITSADYAVCSQIYGVLLYEPETAETYLPELVETMAGLSRDPFGVSAWQRMYELRNLLEHGA